VSQLERKHESRLAFFIPKNQQIYFSEYLLYICLIASYVTHDKKHTILRTFPSEEEK